MKIGITGTHGVGKSTYAFKLAEKYKLQYPTKTVGIIQENASLCPLPINKETTIESQLWIFSRQIVQEIEYSTKYDIVICDRTIFDCIPYALYRGFVSLSNHMLQLAKIYANSYDEIIFKTIRNNDFLYPDGVRNTDDLEYRTSIEKFLINIYLKELDFIYTVDSKNYKSDTYTFKLVME